MKLSQTYIGMFTINDPVTGEPIDADSTPIVSIFRNGELDIDITASVTDVTPDPSTNQGVYKISVDKTWGEGGFLVGDKVDIYVFATINSVNSHAIIDSFILDNGIILASDGLDSISTSEPSGRASNFREMVVQSWMRFFNKVTLDNEDLKVYKKNGSVGTTQEATDSGTTQTVEKA